IVFVNQLEPGDDLSATDSLVIPVPPAASSKSRLTLYKVEHGDTLVTVADRFNVTVQQLRRWNHLTAARLEPGRRLYVAEPAHIARVSSKHRGGRTKKAPSRASSSNRASAKNGKET
ncbi:MAG TPA: LysM peptidoglycan-binding domain-containing protein, partial [Acidobacteriaceae bacterium]|nr:LysM peptidoglycan-binding domain-containing protein [Acidobacteriaceae bacterium]